MPLILDTTPDSSLDFCIQIRDPEASIRFYRDILSFVPYGELGPPDRHIWGMRLGPTVIRLVHEKQPLSKSSPRIGAHDRAYGYFMLAIAVKNAADVVQECVEQGYEVEVPFSLYPPGIAGNVEGSGYAYIRDPDGNMIELLQGSPWSPPST